MSEKDKKKLKKYQKNYCRAKKKNQHNFFFFFSLHSIKMEKKS